MLRLILIAGALALFGCKDNADDFGVGAQCTVNDDCQQSEDFMQTCLAFKGGYCGIQNCVGDADCPPLSKCVAHTDGIKYCFRTCIDKPECNANREVINESNCSSNVTFVNPESGIKACVPPSS